MSNFYYGVVNKIAYLKLTIFISWSTCICNDHFRHTCSFIFFFIEYLYKAFWAWFYIRFYSLVNQNTCFQPNRIHIFYRILKIVPLKNSFITYGLLKLGLQSRTLCLYVALIHWKLIYPVIVAHVTVTICGLFIYILEGCILEAF